MTEVETYVNATSENANVQRKKLKTPSLCVGVCDGSCPPLPQLEPGGGMVRWGGGLGVCEMPISQV
jgi:hypothetical protein